MQVNGCFQAAFHLLQLLAGGFQLVLDQALWPNLPLRLLYGSKLKRWCGALEQITSGIFYGYSQPPLTGGTEEGSIVCAHNADQSDQTETGAHLFSAGVEPLPHLAMNHSRSVHLSNQFLNTYL